MGMTEKDILPTNMRSMIKTRHKLVNPPMSAGITGRRFDVIASRFCPECLSGENHFHRRNALENGFEVDRIISQEMTPNLSHKDALEVRAEKYRQGFGRVDIIEIKTMIPTQIHKNFRADTFFVVATGKTEVGLRATKGTFREALEIPTERNFVPSFNSNKIPYVEARLTQRQVVRQNVAKEKAREKYYRVLNSDPRPNFGNGPREIRTIR